MGWRGEKGIGEAAARASSGRKGIEGEADESWEWGGGFSFSCVRERWISLRAPDLTGYGLRLPPEVAAAREEWSARVPERERDVG